MSGSASISDSPSVAPADSAAAPLSPPVPPPSGPKGRSPMRRWGRRLLIAAASLLGLWVLTWLGVPPLLKWQGEKQASALLGRPVHIGKVDFKPWTLELTVSDLRIAGAPVAETAPTPASAPASAPATSGPAGAPGASSLSPDLLKIQRVYVDAALQSIFRLAPVIDALQIDAPEVHLAHLGEGRYDVDDIRARLAARPQPPAQDSDKPQRFALYNISLTGGRISFDDRAVGRQHEVRDVHLALPFISNLPAQRSVHVQPKLAFVVNDSAFDSQAQALPFDDSRRVNAAFKLSQLDLKPYLGYIPAGLPLQLQAATVDADVQLGFEQTPQPALRVDGTLAVTGLKATDATGADALAFEALNITLGDVRPLERQIHLTSVALQGPQLALRRERDGRLNLQKTTKASAKPQKNSAQNDSKSIADNAAGAGVKGQFDSETSAASAAQPAASKTPEAKAAQSSASAPMAQASAPLTIASGAAPEAALEPVAEPASELASTSAAASAAESTPDHAAPSPWKVLVDKVTVQGGAVDFTDETTAQGHTPAVAVRLNPVTLNVADLAWPLPADASAPIRFDGTLVLADADGLTPAIVSDAAPRAAKARSKTSAKTSRRASKANKASGSASASAAAQPPVASASAPASESAIATVSLSLPGGGGPALAFDGQVNAQGAQWRTHIRSVPLALAAPYWAAYLLPRLTGDLDAQINGEWTPPQAADQAPALKLTAERLAFSQLLLADTEVTTAAEKAAAQRQGRRSRASSSALASVAQIELKDVQLDVAARAVTVGQLGVQSPRTRVARDTDQRWMFQDWLGTPVNSSAEPPPPSASSSAKASNPWTWIIHALTLDDGDVRWRDRGVRDGPPVRLDLTQLHVHAQQIDLNSKKPMPLNVSARLGVGETEPGQLDWRGHLALTPLAVQGQVTTQRLPLHVLQPYADGLVNVDILRADSSFKGDVNYSQTAQGPRLRVKGDVALQDWRAHGRSPAAGTNTSANTSSGSSPSAVTAKDASAPTARAASNATSRAALAPAAAAIQSRSSGLGDELLSFKQLHLSGLDVQMEPQKPLQIDVASVQWSDFYARLIIQADGRLSLQDVVKPGENKAAAEAGMPAEAASAAAAASAAQPAAATPAQPDPNAPIIRIGPVKLDGGHIYFSDRFIRPNYSADLTELNGSLSAFSSVVPAGGPQMAELQLTGRAQGTAGLDIKGQLNPLAKPLALDIRAQVSDLDLPPLTPYTIKYAGHGIERGKLSVDVNYVVQPSGQLTATNKLVLHQLEFGEPVPNAPASMPVKLATALLADSNGVIDLDLPISGSLNDPQFSLGPIIVKAIFNVIGKAITAPFTLLARSLGGASGEDMSMVAFAPGTARLDDKTRGQLDKIAYALKQRPQLKMTVVGTANLEAEQDGIRRERLRAMVLAERRDASGGSAAPPTQAASAPASASTVATSAAPAASTPASAASGAQAAGSNKTSLDAPKLSDEEYATLLKRVYRRADIPGKPRNAVRMLRDIPVADMEALLLAHIDIESEAPRQLAVQRAAAVKDYLSSQQVPVAQLFIGAPRTGAQALAPAAGAASAAAAAATPASASESPARASESAATGPSDKAAAGWTPRANLALSAR
ncbi:DUF748 domain-containing protein [Ottowia sp.]|uniref:DUF748 domain-containing protein n=1 Tax=Ottowia sp. TaxID=1898956 RepID=UPI003A86947D